MRSFLQDYRPNIVGLLKRHNGVNGKVLLESKKVLDRIVDSYVALMTMADFVEVSVSIWQFLTDITDSSQHEEESMLDGRLNGFT